MPRKKKSKVYFGKDVQDAIIRYNLSDDFEIKNKIYELEIHKAFDKLSENIINTFKFMYFDVPFRDVKAEVVAFMVMNIHKYDHTKGSKAFSYFSVVAKNYLILHNNNNYKKLKTHDELDSSNVKESLYHKSDNNHIEDLIKEVIRYFEYNIHSLFKKKKDIEIAYAIVELLNKKDDIENFNKKSLYILIREMADVNTSHITSVVNVMKKYYKKILNEYYLNGAIINNKTGSFF